MVRRVLDLEAKRHTDSFMDLAKKKLGVDLAAVVREEDLAAYLDAAATRNAGLIKTLGDDCVGRVKRIVTDAVIRGTPVKDTRKAIADAFGVSDSRAQLIARDQTAKLNSDLNRIGIGKPGSRNTDGSRRTTSASGRGIAASTARSMPSTSRPARRGRLAARPADPMPVHRASAGRAMTPVTRFLDGSVTLYRGDARTVLSELPDASIDAVVTDPPYAFEGGFMGKRWDTGAVAFDPAFWREVLRVLKPGGHLVACGGTRTQHRLVCAIEDAGFEIRDALAWLYGRGFPKSLDVSKALDRMAGAEREVVGRKGGRYATPKQDFRNGSHHAGADTGKTAIFDEITTPATDLARQWSGWGSALKPAMELYLPRPQAADRNARRQRHRAQRRRLAYRRLSCTFKQRPTA